MFQGLLEHFHESSTYGTEPNKIQSFEKFVNIARDYFRRYPLYRVHQVRNLPLDSRMVATGRYRKQM